MEDPVCATVVKWCNLTVCLALQRTFYPFWHCSTLNNCRTCSLKKKKEDRNQVSRTRDTVFFFFLYHTYVFIVKTWHCPWCNSTWFTWLSRLLSTDEVVLVEDLNRTVWHLTVTVKPLSVLCHFSFAFRAISSWKSYTSTCYKCHWLWVNITFKALFKWSWRKFWTIPELISSRQFFRSLNSSWLQGCKGR